MRAKQIVRGLFWCTALLAIVAVLGASSAQATTIGIDHFAAPADSVNFISFSFPSFTPVPSVTIPTLDASILGLERIFDISVVGPPDWMAFSGSIGSDVLQVATWGRSGSVSTLSYPSVADVDLTDGGTNNVVDLAFDFLEAGSLSVKVAITGDGGNTAVFDSSAKALGNALPSTTPFVYSIPFDQFTISGGNPLANADSIVVTLNDPVGGPLANVDFELNSISVSEQVPEPSTLALLVVLGISATVIAVRKRKQ